MALSAHLAHESPEAQYIAANAEAIGAILRRGDRVELLAGRNNTIRIIRVRRDDCPGVQ